MSTKSDGRRSTTDGATDRAMAACNTRCGRRGSQGQTGRERSTERLSERTNRRRATADDRRRDRPSGGGRERRLKSAQLTTGRRCRATARSTSERANERTRESGSQVYLSRWRLNRRRGVNIFRSYHSNGSSHPGCWFSCAFCH